jgi:hypothetical protein
MGIFRKPCMYKVLTIGDVLKTNRLKSSFERAGPAIVYVDQTTHHLASRPMLLYIFTGCGAVRVKLKIEKQIKSEKIIGQQKGKIMQFPDRSAAAHNIFKVGPQIKR